MRHASGLQLVSARKGMSVPAQTHAWGQVSRRQQHQLAPAQAGVSQLVQELLEAGALGSSEIV